MTPTTKLESMGTSSADRTDENDAKTTEDMEDAAYEVDELADAKPRKKRKIVKTNGEKKYLCPQNDCGKSYSRAEHLYRHQLNRMCESWSPHVTCNESLLTVLEIAPSPYTDATFQAAIVTL